MALLLIQILVYAITGLYKRTHALTYFPSALLLLFLTSIPSDIGNEICLGAWVYVFPLALIVFGFGTIFLKRFQRWEPEVRYFGVSSQLIWINLGILLLLLLMVGCLSNSDEAFASLEHFAHVEPSIAQQGEYLEAYARWKEILGERV